jgi:nucleotide-binding universal stress UspA family protein
MFQKILVAVDKSDNSRKAFNEAIALAKATNASVMLLHVLSPQSDDYPDLPLLTGFEGYYSNHYEAALERQMKELQEFEERGLEFLRSLADQAKFDGITVEFSQNSGDPGRTICALARSWQADAIVIGRRGHSGLTELFLGSVSNYVLHHAQCSVLTIQGAVHQDAVESLPKAAAMVS